MATKQEVEAKLRELISRLEATEEAVYNSLLRATPVTSALGTAEALPIGRVVEVLRRYGRPASF